MNNFIVSLSYPPYLSVLLLGLAALTWLLRRRGIAAAIAGTGIAWSLLWSIPACSEWIRGTLERRHPLVDEASLPVADAIVVLGGGHYVRHWRSNMTPDELRGSRLAMGARAWMAGRAPVVVLSGGGSPSEASVMAAAIGKLGVPASALLLEQQSRNTEDNATNTARLASEHGIRCMLLVTSALHMPRARFLFERAGLDVVPVPVPEYAHPDGRRDWWLPARGALWRSGRALKEHAALFALRTESIIESRLFKLQVIESKLFARPLREAQPPGSQLSGSQLSGAESQLSHLNPSRRSSPDVGGPRHRLDSTAAHECVHGSFSRTPASHPPDTAVQLFPSRS